MNKFVALLIIGLVIATGFTMVTYQVFFSGFTDLHNLSKTPAYDLNGTQVFTNGTVLMQIARVELQTPFTLKRGTYTVMAYDVDDQDSAYGINFQATVKVIS